MQLGRVLLLLAPIVVVACAGIGPVGRGELVSDPAWKLRMPGAEELAHVSAERRMTLDGPVSAHDGFVFGTQASDLEVLEFYDRQLGRAGWVQDLFALSASTVELRLWAWCKPRIWFRLATQDQPRAHRPEFYRGRSYVTVFDASLQGRDPDAPCPKT